MERQHGVEGSGRPDRGQASADGPPDPDPAAHGIGLLTRIEGTLGTGTAAYLPGDGWIRLTLPIEDGGPAPVTVDVLADPQRPPHGIAYLLPGGGLNFAADFFTPTSPDSQDSPGLAHHLLRQGLLVVGVTPREDSATAAGITADWGLAAHRRDLAAVVAALDGALGLPYQYAGHSAGAALALDAASHDASPRLTRVVVLDTTGPYTGDGAERAALTRDAYEAQLAQGTYASDPGLAALIARAVTDPAAPSPVPWPPDPELRFTNAGLAHFALIRTSVLPGPANWIYAQGHSAGSYTFGATPAEDRFTLTRTPLATWHAATSALGSGADPDRPDAGSGGAVGGRREDVRDRLGPDPRRSGVDQHRTGSRRPLARRGTDPRGRQRARDLHSRRGLRPRRRGLVRDGGPGRLVPALTPPVTP